MKKSFITLLFLILFFTVNSQTLIFSTSDGLNFITIDSVTGSVSMESDDTLGDYCQILVQAGGKVSQIEASNGYHTGRLIDQPTQIHLYNDSLIMFNCNDVELQYDATLPMQIPTYRQLQDYNKPHIIFAPVTGGTVNLVANSYNIINPAAASLASLTFHFPAMNNNDVIIIKSTKKIISLTITGQTIAYSITPITIGTFIYLTYDASAGVLY